MLPEGLAEIEAGQSGQEIDELDRYGPIETELPLERRPLLGSGLEGQHDLHRVAHHPGHDEDDHGHPEDDDGAVPDASQDVSAHAGAFLIS